MKKILVFIATLLMAALMQAESWQVCVGSYIDRKNAVNFQAELKEAGYQAVIQEIDSGAKKFIAFSLGKNSRMQVTQENWQKNSKPILFLSATS